MFGLDGDDLILDRPVDYDGPDVDDRLSGGSGDDGVYGEHGDDSASGGPGDDDVSGGLGSDLVSSDDGDDYVDGGPPFDTFCDTIYGGAGDDAMDAFNSPPVTNLVYYDSGNDLVYTDGINLIASDCEAYVRGPDPDSDDLLYIS